MISGRWFEAWRVSDQLVHEMRHTVTETDNLLMCALSHTSTWSWSWATKRRTMRDGEETGKRAFKRPPID